MRRKPPSRPDEATATCVHRIASHLQIYVYVYVYLVCVVR